MRPGEYSEDTLVQQTLRDTYKKNWEGEENSARRKIRPCLGQPTES